MHRAKYVQSHPGKYTGYPYYYPNVLRDLKAMCKLGGSELSGLILNLRTRCKAMRNTYPVEYGREILLYESIIKHLMELQRYRVSMRIAEEQSDIRSD